MVHLFELHGVYNQIVGLTCIRTVYDAKDGEKRRVVWLGDQIKKEQEDLSKDKKKKRKKKEKNITGRIQQQLEIDWEQEMGRGRRWTVLRFITLEYTQVLPENTFN